MISIKFLNDYKSFKKDSVFELREKLSILSGVNGSGKSQLLNVLGEKSNNICEIKINNQNLKHQEVIFRSFRQGVSSIPPVNPLFRQEAIDKVFQMRNTGGLTARYTRSSQQANRYLEDYKTSNNITRPLTKDDIDVALPDDFIWQEDDIFTNNIADIIFRYCFKESISKGIDNIKNDSPLLTEYKNNAPWTKLNNLFKELNFDYRFKDLYFLSESSSLEGGKPNIYPLLINNEIDENSPRDLSELSDGEKAIISLAFATLIDLKSDVKLLLLDEYDATFNPSLTKCFYRILEDYFIKKGVNVILTTHSPVTIALAPDYTSFYEVFKPSSIDKKENRILPVGMSHYSEISKGLDDFYSKVFEQTARFQEMKKEKETLELLVKNIEAKNDILYIWTEGNNIDHIKCAIKSIQNTLLDNIKFVTKLENKTGKNELQKYYDIFNANQLIKNRILFIFDCDVEKEYDSIKETDKIFKFRFAKNNQNTKTNKGIENLYSDSTFDKDCYDEKIIKIDYYGDFHEPRFNKINFANKIKASTDGNIFSNFKPLIEKINLIIKTTHPL